MELKKSRKASLESKRFLFFKLGLLFAIVTVFCSFEWRFYGFEVSNLGEVEWEDEPIIEIDSYQIVLPKKKVVPPKPKLKILDLSKKLDIVKDEITIPDVESFTIEELNNMEFDAVEEDQYLVGNGKLNLDALFSSKELSNNPKFGERERDLDLYIKSKLNLSNTGIYEDVTIDVSFVIEKDGKVSNIKILDSKGLSYSALLKLKKLFEKMPSWSPGKYGSIPVRCQLVKPINIVFGG